jgi:hypothetical protein
VKAKNSTSVITRSFWRLRENRLVLVSSAIPAKTSLHTVLVEDAANFRYAAATDSTAFPRFTRFRAFSKARPNSWNPSIATAARIPSRLPK